MLETVGERPEAVTIVPLQRVTIPQNLDTILIKIRSITGICSYAPLTSIRLCDVSHIINLSITPLQAWLRPIVEQLTTLGQ